VKKYGLGGAGLPGIFFADGDDANRASALEMNAPAAKKFQDRQNNLAALLNRILTFVIECAVTAGVLPEGIDQGFTIEFPEIVIRDLQKGAAVLQGVAVAMSTGVEEGWVTSQTAARAFHSIMSELGVDIEDSQEEYENAQEEKQSRAREAQNNIFPQSKFAEALDKLNGNKQATPITDDTLPVPEREAA
jgi:hypothetical protein